jgi:uncharacterized protein (TIGR03083 family)
MALASHVVELKDYVDAFEQSVRSLLALLEPVDEADWARPTELPGWSVHDVVSHLAALERELLGDPLPPAVDGYGSHVRSEFGQHMENGVAARRTHSAAALTAELREAVDARLPEMRAMRADATPVRVVAGEPWDAEKLLRNRAFDAWMHEQDVRRALTRPGNLDGRGADVAMEILLGALPFLVAKRARATPGQSVRLEVTGVVAFTATVRVGDDGRAALATAPGISSASSASSASAEAAEPTAVLRADWETVVRLLGGRLSPNDAVVELWGDTGLARRLVDRLAVTP